MYKVLVVDNSTVHLPKLIGLINEKITVQALTVETTREVVPDQVESADLIVLSGGTGRSIEKNPITFRNLTKLIAESGRPVIGVCLGAEALAVHFGGRLEKMPIRRVGNTRISLEEPLRDALGANSIMVNEFHSWLIASGGELQVLATSKDRIEAFRHPTRPIFGLQFHPEIRRRNNDGHRIFETFLVWAGLRACKTREL